MPRRTHRLALLLIGIFWTIVAHDPRAAVADDGLALHAVPHGTVTCASTLNPENLTTRIETFSTASGPFYDVYVIACLNDRGGPTGPPTGIGGAEFGITYPGGYAPAGGLTPICVFDWVSCGDLQFPSTNWPEPGGGNLVTWQVSRCSTPNLSFNTSYALAGYFYLAAYAPAAISLTPRPVSGRAKVADCQGREFDFTSLLGGAYLGRVGFGSQGGWNGCLHGLPVKSSTWSGLKATY